MNERSFFKAIQDGALKGAYLLTGEEEYVKESALKALTDTVDPISRELNLQYMDGGSADEVISACETLPFFAERRLLICRFLPQGDDGKALAAYLPRMPDTALLVFFIRNKADEKLSLVKALRKDDRVVDFAPLTPLDAARWVRQQARRLGSPITDEGARLLVSLVGVEVASLHNELNKAVYYAGPGNEVTKEAIAASVRRNVEMRVFDMVDYFLAGKAAEGIRAYRIMLSEGESPFRIAALLEGNFRRMLMAKAHMEQGCGREEALRRMGNTYPMKKAWDGAKLYTKEALLQSLRRFADVGYLQVSGQRKDALSLEDALILCMPPSKLHRSRR